MLIKNLGVLKKNGVAAIFNPFYPNPVFINEKELQNYLAGKWSDTKANMLNDNGLIETGKQPNLKKFRSKNFPKKEVMTMYLILTRTCNLRCRYCFEVERKGVKEYSNETMTAEIALGAVDIFSTEFLQNRHNWNYQIILYGGEPIINWKVIEITLNYIKKNQADGKLPTNLKIALNTNGTLVVPSKAKLLSEHGVSVAVSIDGNKATHDRNRIDALGKGTFDRAIKGYKIMENEGVLVCPSITISPEIIDGSLEIIKSLHQDLKFKALGINPLMASPKEFSLPASQYHKKMAKMIIDCFKWCRKIGISEDRAMRKVNSFIDMDPHIADCCAYGQQIVVQPDGSIGICHATKEHNYCSIWNYTSPYETPLTKKWIKRLPIFNKKCEQCEAIFICGGGCAHSAKLLHGSTENLDSGFCIHTKAMLEYLIWETYKNN